MTKLGRDEIARAMARVERDGPVRVADLTELSGAAERTMIRWATDGKNGVHLDAIFDGRRKIWFSSRQAVLRFLMATAGEPG